MGSDEDRVEAPPGQHELPYSDGEPMESKRHVTQMNLLITTLDDAWADRRDFYVAGNMFVYFSELQTRGEHFRGPDVFVVLGTERKARKSWVTWEEGGKLPNVVIELLSESTEHVDRGEKMRIYARVWRTPEYFLYDPMKHTLEGYALDARRGEYVRVEPDASGDLRVEQLGLALGLRAGDVHEETGPWLRWIDARGEVLPTGAERAEAERERAEAERERADAEHVRAQQAEQRLAALEAELERARSR